MNRSLALVALFAALSTAACAGSSEEPTAGASQDAVSEKKVGHRAQVAACEEANELAGETAGSTVEMIQMEADLHDCLTQANDAAVPVIESILKENDSSSVGSVKAALTAAREGNEKLCEELDKASGNFGGSLQRIERVSCAAAREHLLAKIIDDMVAFEGVEPTYIEADRANHAACYQAYDATEAESTAAMIGVNADLIECIRKEMTPLIDATAQSEVENDASFGPLAAAKARVAAVVDGHTDQVSGLCGAIAEAGENGIGTLSRVSGAVCAVRVTEAAFKTLQQ